MWPAKEFSNTAWVVFLTKSLVYFAYADTILVSTSEG
jgi:hypothetical protein